MNIKTYIVSVCLVWLVTLLTDYIGHHLIFSRIWNKFGAPPGYLTRTGDFTGVLSLWWIDPQKNAQLEQARRDSSLKLEKGPEEDRYWLNYGQSEQLLQPQQRKSP